MEYGAVFATDSNGFFKRSLIESCVVGQAPRSSCPSCGEVRFQAALRGDPGPALRHGRRPGVREGQLLGRRPGVLAGPPPHRPLLDHDPARYKAKLKRGLAEEATSTLHGPEDSRPDEGLPAERIAIDAQGGGVAVMEALAGPGQPAPGERPLLPVIDPDDPKDTDDLPGDHIIEVVQFAKADWVRDANHGMRKDFEDRALLFPEFDPSWPPSPTRTTRRPGPGEGDETDAASRSSTTRSKTASSKSRSSRTSWPPSSTPRPARPCATGGTPPRPRRPAARRAASARTGTPPCSWPT
jgi:hypothetical protein